MKYDYYLLINKYTPITIVEFRDLIFINEFRDPSENKLTSIYRCNKKIAVRYLIKNHFTKKRLSDKNKNPILKLRQW